MGYDTHFGFDLVQRKTLDKLLAAAGLTTEQAAAVALVAAIPTSNPGDGVSIWNNAGSLEVATGP